MGKGFVHRFIEDSIEGFLRVPDRTTQEQTFSNIATDPLQAKRLQR
jgi:hypothetical protein